MEFKFQVTADFKNNTCDSLDVVVPMSGADKAEAENRVVDHIIEVYGHDFIDIKIFLMETVEEMCKDGLTPNQITVLRPVKCKQINL